MRGLLDPCLVFLGAGLGGLCRHFIQVVAVRLFGAGFPIGVLAINLFGCLLIGVVAGVRVPLSESTRLFLTTGVLGGFTTFSTFALDAVKLGQRGELGLAFTYALSSVVLGVGAALLGLAFARSLH